MHCLSSLQIHLAIVRLCAQSTGSLRTSDVLILTSEVDLHMTRVCVNRCSYMRKGMQLAYQGLNVVVHLRTISLGVCLLSTILFLRWSRCTLWESSSLHCVAVRTTFFLISPCMSAEHCLPTRGLFVFTQAKCVLSTVPPSRLSFGPMHKTYERTANTERCSLHSALQRLFQSF